MIRVFAYRDSAGRQPFTDWFDDLDAQAAAKVRNALAQLEAGSSSEVKPVGQDGQTILILLGGGTKATQSKDIKRAIACWTDYKQRQRQDKP